MNLVSVGRINMLGQLLPQTNVLEALLPAQARRPAQAALHPAAQARLPAPAHPVARLQALPVPAVVRLM